MLRIATTSAFALMFDNNCCICNQSVRNRQTIRVGYQQVRPLMRVIGVNQPKVPLIYSCQGTRGRIYALVEQI